MAGSGKGVLRIAIEDFFTTTKIGKWLSGWYVDFIEDFEGGIASNFSEVLTEISKIPELKKYFDPALFGKGTGVHQGAAAMLGGFALNLGMGAASAFLAPIMRMINYAMDKKIHSARLDPNLLIAAFRTDHNLINKFSEDFLELGYTVERFQAVMTALAPIMQPGELIQLYNRKTIDRDTFNTQMLRHGFNGDEINRFEALSHVIPGVQDLLSMAVREAWNDETSARFDYDAERPDEAGLAAEKQGLDVEWFNRYWRAHWQLISPNQGFEMIHRLRPGTTDNPFTLDDMLVLLKTADYPKFFRERLLEISYSPYTRVDVRRMFKFGILSREDVKGAYMDIGYDEEHAENLTKFTEQYETATEKTKPEIARDLNQGTIIDAYKKKIVDRSKAKELLKVLKYDDQETEIILKAAEFAQVVDSKPDYSKQITADLKNLIDKAYASRMISRDEATTMLTGIQFSPEEVKYFLDTDDFQYEESVLADTLKLIGDGYINHSLAYTQVVAMLGKANITGEQQNQLFNEWEQQKTLRNRRLTEAEYRKGVRMELITEDDYRDALQGLGYTDKDIDLLIKINFPPAPIEEIPPEVV